jgi:predicted extracellular nuclease
VVAGQSIERAPAHCDSDSAADWLPRTLPTPGVITMDGECRIPADPTQDMELISIGDIQGDGDVSPLINQTVSFLARVTGALSDRNTEGVTFHTLFVQSPRGHEDGNPATSDGMALFLGTSEPRFAPGDDILVTGQVTEFFGYTEVDNNGLEMTLLGQGNPLPPAVHLDTDRLIGERAEYLETLESMWVTFPPARVVGPTLDICSLTVVPVTTPYVHVMAGEPVSALLDVLHTSDSECKGFPQLKVGDEVDGLSGPLIYHFEEFKLALQRADELTIEIAPLPGPFAAPLVAPGQFSAATFNLHDHFDSSPDPGAVDAPALSPVEVNDKRTKLADVIAEPLGCPTLLAVQEVENLILLEELASALERHCGFRYVIAHLDSPDERGIDLALLGDSRRATLQQVALHQTCSRLDTGVSDASTRCRAGWSPLFSRPPLVVELLLDDHPLTVIVNHFKSRREGEAETAPLRLAQGQHVAQLVDRQLQATPEALILVMGDFNDSPGSATWQALTGDGKLQDGMAGVELESRYSYIFSGVAELLDGILLSPAAGKLLVAADIAHVNADCPAGWAADNQLLFRSSDHDIPLVILELPQAPAPVAMTPAVPTASLQSSAQPAEVSTEETEATAGKLPIYINIVGCVTVGLAALGVLWMLRRRAQATA